MKKGLNKINNRILDLQSHYQFQEKMKYQGKKYNCSVMIVDESYTTKTCGKCGLLNHTVGKSKIFNCLNCKILLERDYHAARNILIKSLIGLDRGL